jgi:hypothetical protein
MQQGLFCIYPETRYRVTDLEYFYDNDPGFGNGIPVVIDTAHSIVAEFIADTTTLSAGNHVLLARVKDEAGNWSIVQDNSFMFGHLLRTWVGTVSSNWNVAGNWSPEGVPIWNDKVLIPSAASAMPVIMDQGLSCWQVFLQEGSQLVIAPGIVLSVMGK